MIHSVSQRVETQCKQPDTWRFHVPDKSGIRPFAGRFEQSRARMTVNLTGAANHAIGKNVEFPLRARRGDADLLKKLAMPNETFEVTRPRASRCDFS